MKIFGKKIADKGFFINLEKSSDRLNNVNSQIEKYKIDARFSISIHDEIRYIVKEEDKYVQIIRDVIFSYLTTYFEVARMSFPMNGSISAISSKQSIKKEPFCSFDYFA